MAKRFLGDLKSCSCCGIFKNFDSFYKRSDKKHLLSSRCKDCISLDMKESVKRRKESHSRQQKIYHLNNREKRLAYLRGYQQRPEIKKRRREADSKRRKEDVNFRLGLNIRNRIRMALKRNSKSGSTLELIGCDILFLKDYLSKLFTDGMSWDNYGEWQIDHILPCSSFDLSKKEQQLLCFNYKNLQPLWALDNLIKKNKIIEKEVSHR